MYKKLDEKTIEAILESGIDVFVEKGLMGAGMNEIAKRSGVSVGVIYKYFSDKDSFFLHCVNHSLELLDKVLEEAALIDGCSRFSTFTRIAVPGAIPMLVTGFLFSFVWQWTDFYYSSVLMPEMDFLATKLLDVKFSWIAGIEGDLSASVSYAPRLLLLILPLVILYCFTQRFFVESVERSGIVG